MKKIAAVALLCAALWISFSGAAQADRFDPQDMYFDEFGGVKPNEPMRFEMPLYRNPNPLKGSTEFRQIRLSRLAWYLFRDWAQTNEIQKRGRQEAFILLGKHPSAWRINAHFVAVSTGVTWLAMKLPETLALSVIDSLWLTEKLVTDQNEALGSGRVKIQLRQVEVLGVKMKVLPMGLVFTFRF